LDSFASLKANKQLIGQTPLIANPDRETPSFQTALSSLPTEKLQSFCGSLPGEDH
jgi:hypothetical protein